MGKIIDVHARQILDSHGSPTIEAEERLDTGAVGWAAVPSGASTGTREAIGLRDGDCDRYFWKGVCKAIAHVNGEICNALLGREVTDQRALDDAMIALVSLEKRIAGAEKVGKHKTSMLQDVEAGRVPEIDALVGSVVELGRGRDRVDGQHERNGLYEHGIPAYAYSTEIPVAVPGAKYQWARGAGLI